MNSRKILILGVTAGGKASLAFEMAKKLSAEIISVDSMKVYRRMDIGTAKPSVQRQKQINYHLIDVAEPSESFSVDKFLRLTETACSEILAKNKPVIACGGTAMYIKALLYGLFDGPGTDEAIRCKLKARIAAESLSVLYAELKSVDPVAAERIHANDEKRIIRALEVYELCGRGISTFQQQFDSPCDTSWTVIGLRREKSDASGRINSRVKKMIADGLVDEVKSLMVAQRPISVQAAAAIGYAEIIAHLKGQIPLEDAIEKIKINTRRFAKSQRTWFKTFRNVNWLDVEVDDTVEQILEKALGVI